jgi:tetratricopeptide (TPR) repeat protein
MHKWKNQNPAIPLATALELNYYRETKQYEAVYQINSKIAHDSPNDFLAQYHLAIACTNSQRYEIAVSEYDKLLTMDKSKVGPDYRIFDVYVYRGVAYAQHKKFEEAISSLNSAHAFIEKENVNNESLAFYYSQIRDVYLCLHNFEQALEAANKAIECNGTVPDYFNQKASILYHLNRYQESVECVSTAIDMDPNNADNAIYYANRGSLYREIDNNLALEDFEKSLQLSPIAETYCRKGMALYTMDRYQEALDTISVSIELDPTNGDAHCCKADCLDRLGKHEEALINFDKAISIDSTNSTFHNNKGYTLNNMERYDEAIAEFDLSIEYGPKVANSYCHKGYAYVKQGKYKEAMLLYDKALELKPEYTRAIERREALLKIINLQ